jgi:dethiobiotin synthetase
VQEGAQLVSSDARCLWQAAGCQGELDRVCPQRFLAPLAPHLAAQAEGRRLDTRLLRDGIDYWRQRSEVIVVEGIGGLMCPLDAALYVADLAREFGFPLVVVSRNALGTINHTLQTLIAAAVKCPGLPIAGIVLNRPAKVANDPSLATNRQELAAHATAPLLAEVTWQAEGFDVPVDWMRLAVAAAGAGP